MLISVSGKINSGKDTIGKILQILLNNPHLNNEGVLSFLKKDINFDSPYYKTCQNNQKKIPYVKKYILR